MFTKAHARKLREKKSTHVSGRRGEAKKLLGDDSILGRGARDARLPHGDEILCILASRPLFLRESHALEPIANRSKRKLAGIADGQIDLTTQLEIPDNTLLAARHETTRNCTPLRSAGSLAKFIPVHSMD